MLRRIVLVLILLLLPSPALAWWDYGHQVIARIAWIESTPHSRSEIRRLLAQARLLETPTCPARTIEQASLWPDCIKRLGDRFSHVFPWHYQNIDICRPFDPASACPDGNCVTAQIGRQARLLADRRLPPRERLMALAFLVHFVGDLHQPLHAADRGDQGGGRTRASYGFITGTNLHLVWDGLLAERGISTPPGGAEGLLSELGPAERAGIRGGTIADWTRESWEVGRAFAYGAVMRDPCATPPEAVAISEGATRRLIPIVRRQAVRGGLRLARLLDEALDPQL